MVTQVQPGSGGPGTAYGLRQWGAPGIQLVCE